MAKVYIIGSLRNPNIPVFGKKLRALGVEAFDDWYAAGERADDSWKDYESARDRTYDEALNGHAATHVFEFDKKHLDESAAGVLILPAGRSGHLELGYLIGSGKPGYILHDDPDRWDVMYRFATGVFFDEEKLIDTIRTNHS